MKQGIARPAKYLASLRHIAARAIAALLLLPYSPAAATELSNEKIRLSVSENGKLESVENLLASETYAFTSDEFQVETDGGLFSNRTTKPASVTVSKSSLSYHFEFRSSGQADDALVSVDLIYTMEAQNGFFRRKIRITNKAPLRVKTVTFGRASLARPAHEMLHYVTFIASPTAEFIRYQQGGLFTGIENPFFQATMDEKGIALRFEPGLILKAGEGYTSEPQFMGVYRKSGVMIEDSGRTFRYNANGSGYKPIDRNEMRAMRAFARDYLAPSQSQFLNINYQFFHPLPQMPHTGKDLDYFTNTIDSFAAIGGDMIILKPLHRHTKPDATKSFWDVVPDDPSHPARIICDRARSKGISYGFYLGIAGGHGLEGDSGGLPFRPDTPEWKKRDSDGRRAPDNCLGCDEFFEWWLAVQNNTIQKYHLSNWSWDPSLGSAMNCYDESHGHIAGKGAYKGWRRGIEMMGRLKAANPGLFIQGFYGTKNFGLWGLRNVDQHEVYNEQAMCVSTRHHQISDDRQNADGLRFQNNWSMRFRFTPAVTGHALTHRVNEGSFDPELIKAWDYCGWRYGVMSSLAVAGTVMPTILPYDTDLVPGYVAFYQKWLRWAKVNFEYVNYTEPFGEQVQPGSVDGYARIKGDHGFIFLFNGNPRSSEITFEVGDEINLQEEGDYELAELYPSEQGKRVLDSDGKSVFALGQSARITVPANSCYLLELQKVDDSNDPALVGAAGRVKQRGQTLEISGVAGKPGQQAPLQVRLRGAARPTSVKVNGVEQTFSSSGDKINLQVQFAGVSYVRELDRWVRADCSVFDFPYHPRVQELVLATTFRINADVPKLLERAKPANFAEMGDKIAKWQQSQNQASYSYHNFICQRPERLWLIIPFRTPTTAKVTLNGRVLTAVMWDSPSNSAYADVTDLVVYGEENRLQLSLDNLASNSFMGPFLLYPEESATNDVLPKPTLADTKVVYKRPLAPPLPPRYRKGAGPRVIEARMMANVTLTNGAELRARLDRPPEEIRSVMFFESGFPWMGQHALAYSQEFQCWTAMVTPGGRAWIQENEDIYVWAEGVDGLRSEYYPVKVRWDFVEGASAN